MTFDELNTKRNKMKNTYETISTLTPQIIERRINQSAARIDAAMDDMCERRHPLDRAAQAVKEP